MRYFMFGYAFIVQGKLGSFSGSISLAVNAFPSQTIINRLIMKDMATMHDVHDGLSISITQLLCIVSVFRLIFSASCQ